MARFTEGPWIVAGPFILKETGPESVLSIAQIMDGDTAQGAAEAKGNKQLICAAPELFAACHKAIEVLRWCRQDTADTFLKSHCETAEVQILQALLKATGQDLE